MWWLSRWPCAAGPPSECMGYRDGDAVPPACCHGPQAPGAYAPFGNFASHATYCPKFVDPIVHLTWFPNAFCDADGVAYVEEYCSSCGTCSVISMAGEPPRAVPRP